MSSEIKYKDAGEKLFYPVNWAVDLAETSTTIATSVWTVDSGITKSGEAFTATQATVFIEGGVAGETYEAKNTITTADGQTLIHTLIIKIND